MNVKLELSIDEVNVILEALNEGKHKIVAGIISKIREQAIPQVSPQAEKKEDKE